MEANRIILDSMIEKFKYWLHIEDEQLLYTLAAIKISHRLQGDPLWMMLIGPSSDGKSELLRSFTREEELTLDNVTPNSFVSGFIGKKDEDGLELNEGKHLAEEIANRTWYIYDFSIILSKHYDERSQILSNLRMIYDGEITRALGTKQIIKVKTPNNTLIVGSTPAIDGTILEDQILGTRFITYRTHTHDQEKVMEKILEIQENELMPTLRAELNQASRMFEEGVIIEEPKLNDSEKQSIMLLTKQTCILRTSVELEKMTREVRNIATPESTGRLFKQLLKLYKSYRIIGLTEEEGMECVRKVCIDSIVPLRLKILGYMMNHDNSDISMGRVAKKMKIGKSTAKGHLLSLAALNLVDYEEIYDDQQKRNTFRFTNIAPPEYGLIVFGERPTMQTMFDNTGSEGGCPPLRGGLYHGG